MKNYIFILFIVSAFFFSCGSDNPVNNINNPNPPTFQDSVVKLYNPVNNFHFNTGDSICYSWNRGFYSSYRLYYDNDSTFPLNNYTRINDTSFCGEWIDTSSSVNYWKVIPYLNDTLRYEYSSEIRRFNVN